VRPSIGGAAGYRPTIEMVEGADSIITFLHHYLSSSLSIIIIYHHHLSSLLPIIIIIMYHHRRAHSIDSFNIARRNPG
jgi:hypothetical protein